MIRREDELRSGLGTSAMGAIGDAVDEVGIASGIDIGGTGRRSGTPELGKHIGAGDRMTGRGHVTSTGSSSADFAIGSFEEYAQGERALAELQRLGFRGNQVGLAMDDGVLIEQEDVLAAADVADRGLFTVLVEMGVPEAEARYYEREFEARCTIVTAKAPGRAQEAAAVLHRHGGMVRPEIAVDHRSADR
jgi:hypothetical protein